MAGDWIKIENTTPDKPEVFRMAERLEIDPDAVTGKLVRIWIWADQQTVDGNAGCVTRLLLDRLAGVSGFADAMSDCGWLQEENGELLLPNFERHNGKTAKTRALTRKRVESHRKNCNADTVTPALPEKSIEKSIERGAPAKPKAKKARPTLEEVQTYCAERKNSIDPVRFMNHYDTNGWVQGKGKPIKDWKAAVRTWESNGFSAGAKHEPPKTDLAARARKQRAEREAKRKAEREGVA
ncbi:hypothetical protein [Stieleria sp.]|uniref:hypothetical protein n=1 Tax=Stieleria sp. TaxID=2795976 RepID=UPI0035662C60